MHGLFGSSDNWMGLGRQFAKHFQVVLIDLRNHGQSPSSEEWDYPSMAADVAELAKDLGHEQINLLGHSMGGKTGIQVAGDYSNLLEKLVVADIAPKYYPVRHRTILDGLLSVRLDQIENRNEAEEQLSHLILEPAVRMFLLKNLEKDPVNGFRWKINLPVIDRHISNVGKDTYPPEPVKIPTLFIRGINSDYVKDEDIMDIRKHFTNSSVESIGNAGHWLHAEQPKAFMDTVMQFLKS